MIWSAHFALRDEEEVAETDSAETDPAGQAGGGLRAHIRRVGRMHEKRGGS